MSAFLMIAATAPSKPLHQHRNGNSANSMGSKSRRSIPSNASITTDGAASRVSPRSITNTSSNTASSTRRRQVFDTNKLQYVDYANTVSLFEQKLAGFNEAVTFAKQNSLGEAMHRTLNTWVVAGPNGSDGQSPLLTPKNLEHLRFNYFEKFEPNLQVVQGNIKARPPVYVHEISADEQLEQLLSKTSNHAQKGIAIGVQAKLASMENSLYNPTNSMSANGHSMCIRDALHSSSFWDDVYHDIRCESLGEHYYDWLPARQTTSRFIVALLDFALYRIRMITCEISESELEILNLDERHELERNNFSYLQRTDSPLVKCLVDFVKKHFLAQLATSVACPNLAYVHEVMGILVACICDNLKLHFYGHSRVESTTALFHDLVMCMFNTVMLDGASTAVPTLTPQSSRSSLNTSMFETVPSAVSESSGLPQEKEQKKPKKRFLSKFRK